MAFGSWLKKIDNQTVPLNNFKGNTNNNSYEEEPRRIDEQKEPDQNKLNRFFNRI